jgi:RNA 2',3'-cyclic 3'-phosphodiesterase
VRLFVAVEISEDARRAAASFAVRLQRRLPSLSARWVPAENMHLTVRFVGHVADGHVPAILDALKTPLPLRAFDIVLGPCGVFPRSGPVRVIWMGLIDGLASLSAMHDEFNRRLQRIGFAPEQRPFSAHLTLARVKDGGSREVRSVVAQAATPAVSVRVTHATVFQSLPSPGGARYEALLRVPLEG